VSPSLRALCLAIALALSVGPSSLAQAQSPTPSSESSATASSSGAADFDAAELARHEGRLADAERLLRRSLAAEPRMETAFNLGAVLADLGRHREASETFAEVAAGAYGTLSPERARIVRERLETSRASIAEIRVRVETSRPTEVRIDGALHGELVQSGVVVIAVDPGTRHVRVAAGEWSVERAIRLEPGDASAVELRVPALVLSEDPPRRRRVALSVAGAFVVAVGVGLAIGLARRESGVERVDDPVWGRVWTLGGAP
jgi:hypothetical protein